MAKPKDEPYKQLPKGYSKQVGSSLSHWTALSIYGFLGHPEYQRLVEYERAMSTDSVVKSAVELITLFIVNSLGEYHHDNIKVKDFVVENFKRMHGSHKMALRELAISALWAGFGVSEAVFKADEGRIWIDYIANYNPRTLNLQVNEHGQLTEGEPSIFNAAFTTGIWQDRLGKTPVRLPMDRCCLVTHSRRYGNYYGESALKAVYKDWRLKEAILEMWNVALDRYGTPVTYAIVPNGFTGGEIQDPTAPEGKRPETIADSTGRAIADIHTGTGLVIQRPSPTDDIELGTLTTGNNFGDSFREAIRYHDTNIYKGLLIPSLLMQEQSGGLGSTSIGKVHFDIFKMMLGALYDEIVEPFVEHIIGKLIRLNFGEQDPGYFSMVPADGPTIELMSNVFVNLCNIGVMDPSDINDLQVMRAQCGLPELTAQQAEKLAKRNQEQQAAQVTTRKPDAALQPASQTDARKQIPPKPTAAPNSKNTPNRVNRTSKTFKRS